MELKETLHRYYCNEYNYFSDETRIRFENWTQFKETWFDDIQFGDPEEMMEFHDLNHCFRFDLEITEEDVEGNPIPPRHYLLLFYIMQRKGIFQSVKINNITEEDLPEVEMYLRSCWKYLQEQWKEVNDTENNPTLKEQIKGLPLPELLKRMDLIRGEKVLDASVVHEEAADAMAVMEIMEDEDIEPEEKIGHLRKVQRTTTSGSVYDLIDEIILAYEKAVGVVNQVIDNLKTNEETKDPTYKELIEEPSLSELLNRVDALRNDEIMQDWISQSELHAIMEIIENEALEPKEKIGHLRKVQRISASGKIYDVIERIITLYEKELAASDQMFAKAIKGGSPHETNH